MTTLRKAAQQALEFVTSEAWGTTPYMDVRVYEDAARLRDALQAALSAALAQQDESCPNCASLEAQNTELDRKLAELEREPQTLDAAMRLPRAMAQAYERGYKAGAAVEREAIIQAIPGGHIVDPQWVCDIIRARGNP